MDKSFAYLSLLILLVGGLVIAIMQQVVVGSFVAMFAIVMLWNKIAKYRMIAEGDHPERRLGEIFVGNVHADSGLIKELAEGERLGKHAYGRDGRNLYPLRPLFVTAEAFGRRRLEERKQFWERITNDGKNSNSNEQALGKENN